APHLPGVVSTACDPHQVASRSPYCSSRPYSPPSPARWAPLRELVEGNSSTAQPLHRVKRIRLHRAVYIRRQRLPLRRRPRPAPPGQDRSHHHRRSLPALSALLATPVEG